jgi:23S rRNA (pseudouridine1915-N3)-methyltransferase
MILHFSRIQPRRRAASPTDPLLQSYLERIKRYHTLNARDFLSESDMLDYFYRSSIRTTPTLILTDSRGDQPTSEAFARRLGDLADRGAQQIVLAVGPADGWSEDARARASYTLAFGRMTLPHELAAVVLAEQTYRALTILAGHPYHTGH